MWDPHDINVYSFHPFLLHLPPMACGRTRGPTFRAKLASSPLLIIGKRAIESRWMYRQFFLSHLFSLIRGALVATCYRPLGHALTDPQPAGEEERQIGGEAFIEARPMGCARAA